MSGTPARIGDLLGSGQRSFSFEFFPPKDEAGEDVLWRSISELEPLQPSFVSVTYGAGGTTRDRTLAITARIAQETSLLPMAHLTCVGHTTAELLDILAALRGSGVGNVLALRGDPPGGPGTAFEPTPGGVDYANELVELVRRSSDLCVGVAAFPEGHRDAATLDDDVAVLRAKQDAGAEFAVTEMVLRASDYLGLVERAGAAGVTIPIVPGIMPILGITSMTKMVELSGRDIPEEVRSRIEPLADDPAAVRSEGIAIATELCDDLLAEGSPGLHFYTLNRSKATREIWSALSLSA
ncbi:methylenetetrahydrofolate reductase [NAD(P)H] [Nocardioides aurantiacus]|uniref:Methylenetetrahydrofolate reductase n=1 Tax=Nocardioides aurantiacus TaxID=86796 RepID=A0A3N2CXV9_9ACTN|nr:methylenetetrahydrofolate reductase [NAD(P)H] [Nocardioides aurantiacus]ROR92054.1 5,10-methylenetetrahydrofolate reductase (NAD(P)) [Nocardioides aurantiacus]